MQGINNFPPQLGRLIQHAQDRLACGVIIPRNQYEQWWDFSGINAGHMRDVGLRPGNWLLYYARFAVQSYPQVLVQISSIILPERRGVGVADEIKPLQDALVTDLLLPTWGGDEIGQRLWWAFDSTSKIGALKPLTDVYGEVRVLELTYKQLSDCLG